jgi:hypothetical protein
MTRAEIKAMAERRGDKSDWLLVLADCEAQVRHTQPVVADMLRDLRWEMRDALKDWKPKDPA